MPEPEQLDTARPGAQRFGDRLLRPEEAAAIEVRNTVRSAVLIPVIERDSQLWTVFTRRPDTLSRHAGEISFPGGRADPGDPDLAFTALREAEEEIGLDPAMAQILGALPPVPTIATGYAIYPFVAAVPADLVWNPSPAEVAELIELPLGDVQAGYARRRLVRRGLPIRTDTYVVGEHLIWGATARILGDLFDRLVR